MPVRKYTRTRRKKENTEPSSKLAINSSSLLTNGTSHKQTSSSNDSSTTNHTTTTTTTAATNGTTTAAVKKQPVSSSITSSSSSSSSSSKSSTSSSTGVPKKSQRTHVRSIKELSSALNLSTSFSTSFSAATTNNNNTNGKCNSNRKITDYFQIRKSSRKCKSDLDKERHEHIEHAIKSGRDDTTGLEVRVLPDKGRAVFAARAYRRGDFVCEYAGEMIPYALAKKREEMYAQDQSIGCYMYFFEYKSKQLCIDATSETDRLGRLLNHSKLDGNCQAKLFETASRPYIILVAARDIRMGEELTYDYGERNKSAIEAHPWLAS